MARLHWTYVNSHRDTKKQFQPYALADFLTFAPKDDAQVPPVVGRCARSLAEDDLWPDWAIWAWPLVENVGEGLQRKGQRCLLGEGVLILAPVVTENAVSGFAIGQSAMVGEWVDLRNPDRPEDPPITVQVPDLFQCDTGCSAEADAWFKVDEYV